METIFNPSGSEMFSKAGRHTNEIFIIFAKKDEILYNKKKTFQSKLVPDLEKEETNDDINQFEYQNQKKIQKKQIPQQKEQIEPFSKILSRAYIERIKGNQHPPPDVGYYKPKYNQLDNAQKKLWDFKKVYMNTTSSRMIKKPPKNLEQEMTKPVPEKTTKRVTGFIDLQRQIDRPAIFGGADSPHEERFTAIRPATACSSYKKVPYFSIDKSSTREKQSMYKKNANLPTYKPNFLYGQKQLSISIPDFNKMRARKNEKKPTDPTQNEGIKHYDYEFYNRIGSAGGSQLVKRVQSPNFKKILAREKEQSSKLPTFMQKNMHSRMDLNVVNQKMLESNYYSDGRFQTSSTQFNFHKKTKKIAKITLDFEQNDSLSLFNL